MKSYLSSFSEVHENDLKDLSADPKFRKATLNMMAAHQACAKTLAGLSEEEKKSLAVVVSTNFGEVSASLDFLTSLVETGIAKPILFQNSLHNSTLGFVSIAFGLQGPALTVSADRFSDSAVMNTVSGLLQVSDKVLVCFVDVIPDFLKKYYNLAFPYHQTHFEWARSFIVSKEVLAHSKAQSMTASFEIENLSAFNFSANLSMLQKSLN